VKSEEFAVEVCSADVIAEGYQHIDIDGEDEDFSVGITT